MTCEECKSLREPREIPYAAHEAAMYRAEKNMMRMWVIVLLLIIMLVGTNCAWLYWESQFEEVTSTTEIEAKQSGEGTNIVSGGDLTYGADGTH